MSCTSEACTFVVSAVPAAWLVLAIGLALIAIAARRDA